MIVPVWNVKDCAYQTGIVSGPLLCTADVFAALLLRHIFVAKPSRIYSGGGSTGESIRLVSGAVMRCDPNMTQILKGKPFRESVCVCYVCVMCGFSWMCCPNTHRCPIHSNAPTRVQCCSLQLTYINSTIQINDQTKIRLFGCWFVAQTVFFYELTCFIRLSHFRIFNRIFMLPGSAMCRVTKPVVFVDTQCMVQYATCSQLICHLRMIFEVHSRLHSIAPVSCHLRATRSSGFSQAKLR